MKHELGKLRRVLVCIHGVVPRSTEQIVESVERVELGSVRRACVNNDILRQLYHFPMDTVYYP